MLTSWLLGAAVVVGILAGALAVAAACLRRVSAGEIRLVTRWWGSTAIYRGPGRSWEVPLLTTDTTIPNKAIAVPLDVTEQTADRDSTGNPRPVPVRVLATAIVAVGESDAMVATAAGRFFSKPEAEQASLLADVLAAAGRRAINLVTHEELYSSSAPRAEGVEAEQAGVEEELEEPLAVRMRQTSVRELSDLGLRFCSLSVKEVRSELAEAQRRQVAAEAQADADIVVAHEARRVREARLDAERAISDREREVAEARAANAALIARAAARRQEVQAKADAEKVRVEAQAAADVLRGAQFGLALNEALRITKVAAAQVDGFHKVNEAIREGGESYFRYRFAELLPQIAPAIAKALVEANLAAGSGGGGADGSPGAVTGGITDVIQSALTAQLSLRRATLDAGPAGVGMPALRAEPDPVARKARRRPVG